MPQVFAYKARSLSGSLINGKVESDSQGGAVALLREKNYFVVEIKPVRSVELDLDKLLGLKIKIKEMSIFCRQFATMHEAGIPLLQCLRTLVQQTESKRMSRILKEVAVGVEKGKSLSEAFKEYKQYLPEIFISMILAGEVSGTLDQALGRLATHFEKEHQLREKVKSAMTYPLVVAGMSLACMVALLVIVVPIFVDIFNSMGAELPLPTRIVIFLSNVLKGYWYLVLLASIALFFIVKQFGATAGGRKVLDQLALKAPIFGKLTHKTIVARVARTLATLLKSGIPLMQSLETVEYVAGNTVFAGEVRKARVTISEGERMAPVLMKGKMFPPLAINLIAVGEESGALDNLLEKLAVFYEHEVETMVGRLSSVIEPLLIAGVGVMVAFIALSIYMPLFGLAGALQGGSGIPGGM
ncbi:MAG: type II secretion system F family protein [Peptococcaceae bacterium]|nr:type II secretion system F family protein [Peptococcaceae bacterium]